MTPTACSRRLLFTLALSATASMLSCSPSGSGNRPPTLHVKGSDTMLPAARAWASKFDQAMVEAGGGGSGVGIEDLIRGAIDVANTSRRFTAKEVQAAWENTGKMPTAYKVGLDAIAVYVHGRNPIEEIRLAQLAEIFGQGGELTRWSQLGISWPEGRSERIIKVRRGAKSGTADVFRSAVLGKDRPYADDCIETYETHDLITLIGQLENAIGFSSASFSTDEVKILRIQGKERPAVFPSTQTVQDGTYPLVRHLYMYTLGKPRRALREYIQWVRSPEGQALLEDAGYIPLKEPQTDSAPSTKGDAG